MTWWLVLLLVAALAGVMAYGLLRSRGRVPVASSPPAPRGPEVRAPQGPAAPAVAAAPAPGAPPIWRQARELTPSEREALRVLVGRIPRPPRLLNQLLSREFVNEASAQALADLIAADPLLAGRVLKTVNSPFYGLGRPVGSVAHAVQYLGASAIRVVCLRYLFVTAFATENARRRLALQEGWAASALAVELAQKLWPALALPDGAHWSSALLLSWLGRLASVANLEDAELDQTAGADSVARALLEQARWGVAAPELGRLVMSEWGLPETTVHDASDIAWALVAGPSGAGGECVAAAALCAHLAEQLVSGQLAQLADWEQTPAHTHQSLSSVLAPERLDRLREALRGEALAELVQRSRSSWRLAA